jgi:hypothetical protein
MFSSCFCFNLFLSGVFLSFRGIIASTRNDKEKTPSEDDHQDPKLKEEVESEAKEEEMEEDQCPRPSTVVASIGVVTSHDKFKKSARIRTGGGVPRHSLAPRTSSSGKNPFHTLIHEHQFQRVPKPPIFTEASRRTKMRRRGARGQPHHQGARPSSWRAHLW